MPRRVAVLSVALESCSCNPSLVTLADFQHASGSAYAAHEKGAFLARVRRRQPYLLHDTEVHFVGLWRGLAGGAVRGADWQVLVRLCVEGLAALQGVSGVYLDLHGALCAEGTEDAEADLVAALRAAEGVPADALFAASFDLHANVSERLAGLLNVVTAYRTMPHTDHLETQEQAFTLLLDTLRHRDCAPATVHVRVPVCVVGDKLPTEVCDLHGNPSPAEPGASLWGAGVDEAQSAPGVYCCALFAGCPFANEERVGAAVVVTGSPAAVASGAARGAAERLAWRLWEARSSIGWSPATPVGDFPSICAAALAPAARPVTAIVSDLGDNIGGGAPGDLPVCLSHLLSLPCPGLGVRVILAGITDPAAVAAVDEAAGAGRALRSLQIGGKYLSTLTVPSVDCPQVRIVTGCSEGWPPRTAVLAVGGWLTVIVTARKWGFFGPRDFALLDIGAAELQAARMVVVKLGLAGAELMRACAPARNYLADTVGCTATMMETAGLGSKVRRPVWPLDPDLEWRPPSWGPGAGEGGEAAPAPEQRLAE
eukprot:TRINITY_DN38142_c0_g1_i1.p1 TRINITY_DN38142_c0_g1~~TRINITY_DN38142_c0_g1_i1.p1  ORF type:complete len:540 (+),score=157.24 TRINITY_DN38142_c0_g1_i1:86-1705(+)